MGMATGAQRLSFGGETAVDNVGDEFPMMGSGEFAATDLYKESCRKEACQGGFKYFTADDSSGKIPNLTEWLTTSSQCYTVTADHYLGSTRMVSFGGPGGPFEQCPDLSKEAVNASQIL